MSWLRSFVLLVAALPPDVRKAYGFPTEIVVLRLRLTSRRSLLVQVASRRKGKAFPHIGRQSRSFVMRD